MSTAFTPTGGEPINAQSESVAVVGAGPGGLATAMLLLASGVPVTIYEAAATVGGRTSRLTVNSQAGAGGVGLAEYHFDRGPTFFLMPYVLEEIFSASGRRLADYAELVRLDPMYRLVLGAPGGGATVLDTTQDIPEMARRLSAINPSDGAAFQRFIDDNRRKLAVFTPVLRKPFRSVADLLDPALLRAAPSLKPTKSVHTYLGGYFRDPRTKLALSFQSKYLGMSPYDCPSLFSILPFIEYEYGVWHPRGGCNALMAAMATACAEMGGRVCCGHRVEGVEFEGDTVVGVRVGGQLRRHRHVVLNADAPWALRNLLPEAAARRSGWTARRLDKMDYSCSTFMLYLGLDRPVDLPHHTIYVSSRYEENLRDITHTGRLSAEPSLYVCNPSRLDPTLAPPGHSSLYVLVPTPNTRHAIDWSASAPRLRRQALERVSALAGFDVAPHVRAEVQTTPADWQAASIAFGATFNLAHGLGQMLHRRPQHELPGLRGLWLAGGGTHPGSGLPVIFLSAQIAASMLCKRLGVAYAGARGPAGVEPLSPAGAAAPATQLAG